MSSWCVCRPAFAVYAAAQFIVTQVSTSGPFAFNKSIEWTDWMRPGRCSGHTSVHRACGHHPARRYCAAWAARSYRSILWEAKLGLGQQQQQQQQHSQPPSSTSAGCNLALCIRITRTSPNWCRAQTLWCRESTTMFYGGTMVPRH